jgi:hypothetical protein
VVKDYGRSSDSAIRPNCFTCSSRNTTKGTSTQLFFAKDSFRQDPGFPVVGFYHQNKTLILMVLSALPEVQPPGIAAAMAMRVP